MVVTLRYSMESSKLKATMLGSILDPQPPPHQYDTVYPAATEHNIGCCYHMLSALNSKHMRMSVSCFLLATEQVWVAGQGVAELLRTCIISHHPCEVCQQRCGYGAKEGP